MANGDARKAADQALMRETPSKLESMLKIDDGASGGGGAPKVVEVGADGSFELPAAAEAAPLVEEAEEDSLMDMMMADATANRAERKARAKKEETRMKSSFGDGMKKGLKKGFFDAKPAKKTAAPKPKPKPEPKPAPADGPVTVTRRDDAASVRTAIKQEVAAGMAASSHPMAAALKGGEWVTPDLVQAMARRPALAAGMADPRCQAALEEFKRDPAAASKKFDSDPRLKAFLSEFCEVMGAHFETLGAADAPPAPPTAAEKKAMGPLASAVVEDAARGAGPAPASTPKEKAEVDAVLNDAALCDLLMDPKTQELMQRCADPREFEPASAKPRENPAGFDFGGPYLGPCGA